MGRKRFKERRWGVGVGKGKDKIKMSKWKRLRQTQAQGGRPCPKVSTMQPEITYHQKEGRMTEKVPYKRPDWEMQPIWKCSSNYLLSLMVPHGMNCLPVSNT